MTEISPYKIAVSEEKLDILHKKLALTTLPDELDQAGWSYGAPLPAIKRLLTHWHNSYDWRRTEEHLNSTLPQFTTEIEVPGFEPINIHFVHQRSTTANAIPLLFCHGWPGSFLEVSKILPDLISPSSPSAPAFHVVAPSLVNYGFSEGVRRKGFGPKQQAMMIHTLMTRLGYSEYVTQGGDWGFIITRLLGVMYPHAVKASHVNMLLAPGPPALTTSPWLYLQWNLLPLSAAEQAGIARGKWFDSEGSGYSREQSTKPQTIGYSQADSPVGLLAWIYEKLHDWTDNYPWTDDEVCTWVSIYWFSTAGPAAASRLYYESRMSHKSFEKEGPQRTIEHRQALKGYVAGPKLGTARFPKELMLPPKSWARAIGDVVFESEYEQGGHFAAWERPDAIVGDLRTMFGKDGGAFACVSGKNGYDGNAKL